MGDPSVRWATFKSGEKDFTRSHGVDRIDSVRESKNTLSDRTVFLAGSTAGFVLVVVMTKPRPNILFIWTDQQGSRAMSCAGNPHLRTPAMDWLSDGGIRFERAYCTDPICVPSRTSWLTGTMPHENGVTFNTDDHPVDRPPLAPLLRAAGYDTGYVGKWHIPRSADDREWHGFDHVRHARPNGVDPDVPGAAIEFLRQERANPFFLVAGFVNPHDICEWARITAGMGGRLPNGPIPAAPAAEACPPLPGNFEIPRPEPSVIRDAQRLAPSLYPTVDWGEDLWRQYLWAYYRLVEQVDTGIGQILSELQRSGQDRNTVILFSSDHGDGAASHRWNQKTLFYEEVARVPFIIRPPSCNLAGSVDTRNLVSMNLDFFPTVLDYAGLPIPEGLTGRSLRPVLEGQPGAKGHDFVVSEADLAPEYGVTGGVYGRMIRDARFKYGRFSTGTDREQLFDLEADPGETRNLAYEAEYAARKQQCRDRLDQWMEERFDPFPGLEC
ncbi:MAG: sulfatase-like hydrolase/transferase [Opitutaceae bacterium]